MAKMIKNIILFIPFLLLLLFPKIVFADTNNIYFYNIYNSYQFTSYGDLNYTTYNFNALNSEFTLNYMFGNTTNNISFVLYDKVEDTYALLITTFSSNSCLNSSTYNFEGLNLRNGDNINCNLSNRFLSLLSNKDESSYLNNIFNNTEATSTQNGDFYLTQNGKRSWDNYITYINNNASNFEEVSKNGDYTLLFNHLELEKISSSSPEEPEEPEEDIPIYNFDNNKYYVPNYEKGNCVEIIDKDTIRVFKDEFTDFYTDFYINSNYISKTGQVDLNYEKNCSTLEFTNIRYYGNDFPQVLFISSMIILFTLGLPYILLKRFRKR